MQYCVVMLARIRVVFPCMLTIIIAKIAGDLLADCGVIKLIVQAKRYPFLLDFWATNLFGIPDFFHITPVGRLWTVHSGVTVVQFKGFCTTSRPFRGYPAVSAPSEPNFLGREI